FNKKPLRKLPYSRRRQRAAGNAVALPMTSRFLSFHDFVPVGIFASWRKSPLRQEIMHELERLICSGSYDDVLSATSCMGDKSLREARKWIAAQSKMPDAPYRSACRDENGSPWMRLLIACVATARDA